MIGADAGIDQATLEAFASKGGQVLVLPRAQADGGFTGRATELVLRPVKEAPIEPNMDHPDYRADWGHSDEPGR